MLRLSRWKFSASGRHGRGQTSSKEKLLGTSITIIPEPRNPQPIRGVKPHAQALATDVTVS